MTRRKVQRDLSSGILCMDISMMLEQDLNNFELFDPGGHMQRCPAFAIILSVRICTVIGAANAQYQLTLPVMPNGATSIPCRPERGRLRHAHIATPRPGSAFHTTPPRVDSPSDHPEHLHALDV